MKFRMKISLRSATPKILLLLALFLGANIFAVYFISQEKYVYFWDTAGYWTIYRDLCDLLAKEPSKFFWTVVYSIRGEEYNALPVLPLVPSHFLFGEGRMQYILSITNMFLVPSAVLFYFIFRKITAKYSEIQSPVLPVISLLTVLLLPQFWIPVLVGWPDIAGIAIIGVILLVSLDGPVETQAPWKLFILGFLLCLLVLTRRWYAYWAVSFFIALGVERLTCNAGEYGFNMRKYLPAARNISLVAIVSASLFVLGATPIARKMLVTRYADIYSAYKTMDPALQVLKGFGMFVSLSFLSGAVFGVLNRKTRFFALFLIVQFLIIFFLFSSVQNFDHHHYYLLIPAVVIFISFFISAVYSYLKTRFLRTLFLGAYVLLLTLNFSFVLIPGAAGRLPAAALLFSETRYYPLVRNDLTEIDRLKKALQNLTRSDDGSRSSIYVLSSSLALNDDILRNAWRDDPNLFGRILRTSHVDKRDGFPNGLLEAKYVIVTDPVGYHLRHEDQRVIGIPARQIVDKKGIGMSYAKLHYEFALDGNVKAYIYEKVRPFREEDILRLIRPFIEYYPGKEDTFKINYSSRETLEGLPPKPEISVRINYGGKAELRGVTVQALPQGQLLMSYYWKFIEELPSYKAFVHFRHAGNKILFQNDYLLYDARSRERYRGKFVKETYAVDIPPSVHGKEASMVIGLFTTDGKGERLKIESSGETPRTDQDTGAIVARLRL